MARKGRSRKVTRRRKLKGGFNEYEYTDLLTEKGAIPLVQLEVGKKYTVYKVDDLENPIDVEIIRNGRGDGAYDVTVFEDEEGNKTTIRHGEETYYMSGLGYFFTNLKSNDPGPTEDEEDPTGGRRKRKLKRATRRKHL